MQECVKPGEGAMVALLRSNLATAQEIAAKAAAATSKVCEVSNLNSPSQVTTQCVAWI
jgi:malonyl CoA-acyl carrier protein transacylase